jgi:hypothetical protein
MSKREPTKQRVLSSRRVPCFARRDSLAEWRVVAVRPPVDFAINDRQRRNRNLLTFLCGLTSYGVSVFAVTWFALYRRRSAFG